MSLVIDIQLLTDRYEAAGDDPDVQEWPPHPARVFCALVAGARTPADHDALRWLEEQPAPQVFAASTCLSVRHKAYVVTNKIEPRGGSQFHPARSNGLRARASSAPAAKEVRIVWPEADPASDIVACLDQLAGRVPYLGRSTGVALAKCHQPEVLSTPPGLTCFEPADKGPGLFDLRIPFRGYLDALLEQHRSSRPAWEVSRTCRYQLPRSLSEVAPPTAMDAPSAFTDLIMMQFGKYRPDGSLTPLFTKALRRAVMALSPDPLPAALHGHGPEAAGRPHVAFLALPDAGHDHARGHLLGMAVALPELPDGDRRAVVRAVLGTTSASSEGREFRLNVPRVGEVVLNYRPGLVRPWALDPSRWRRGSTDWVSVTPVVLDRFPKKGDIESEIVRSFLGAGLPEPDDVLTSTGPLIPGAAQLRPNQLPEQLRGRIYRHARVRFQHRVAGPVLVGAGRYLGIGLFAPTGETWTAK